MSRSDFWALAALLGNNVVGGITAHTLPMIRAEGSEILIYEIAGHVAHQRKGIGRELISALGADAASVEIHDLLVSADNEHNHALDFYQGTGGEPSPVTFFTFSKSR